MSVFRVEKARDYTVMSNYHLRDRTISLKAKGLLSVMLSLPEDWDYTMSGLARISKEGVGSVKSCIDELETAGYVVHSRVRNAKGQLKGTEYIIFENPVQPEHPCPENPFLDDAHEDSPFYYDDEPVSEKPVLENPTQAFPTPDEPTQENPAQLNKHLPITQKQNTDSSNTQSVRPFPAGGQIDLERMRQEIREQIDYEHCCALAGSERVDEIVELILEVMLTPTPTIQFGQRAKQLTVLVQDRFRKLRAGHIEHFFASQDENPGRIKNTKGYMLASLFNAPATTDNHYQMRVNSDRRGI